MSPLLWNVVGLSVAIYVYIGLRTLGQMFWCLGTAHNGYRKPGTLFIEIAWSLFLIFGWPLIKVFFGFLWVCSKFQPKKLEPRYTDKYLDGTYKCYGVATGRGPSAGKTVVIYQDTKTKELLFRTEDDFEESMMLIK